MVVQHLAGRGRAGPVSYTHLDVYKRQGLDLVLKILRDAPLHLSQDGLLICEVGESEQALVKLLPDVEFAWVEFKVGQMGIFAVGCAERIVHHPRIRQLADARL